MAKHLSGQAKNNKVSVIVLGYNVAQYVNRCIDSIFNQSYHNIELIVVDDCSSDNTWTRLNEIKKNRRIDVEDFILHRNETNKGSAISRNIGLSLASGDYFTFVDGDDWIDSDGIQTMVELACRKNADIVMSDFIMQANDVVQVVKQYPIDMTNIGIMKSILVGKTHGSVCNKLYRKDIVDRFGLRFLDGADYTEDMAFNVRFLIHTNNIVYSQVPYYHYIIRQESMCRSNANNDNIAKRNHQKIENVAVISSALEKSGISKHLKKELDYCKLGARMPLLDNPDKKKCKMWQNTFPESNSAIFSYDRVSKIYRVKLMLLVMNMSSLFLLLNKRSFNQ